MSGSGSRRSCQSTGASSVVDLCTQTSERSAVILPGLASQCTLPDKKDDPIMSQPVTSQTNATWAAVGGAYATPASAEASDTGMGLEMDAATTLAIQTAHAQLATAAEAATVETPPSADDGDTSSDEVCKHTDGCFCYACYCHASLDACVCDECKDWPAY